MTIKGFHMYLSRRIANIELRSRFGMLQIIGVQKIGIFGHSSHRFDSHVDESNRATSTGEYLPSAAVYKVVRNSRVSL